MCRIESAPGFVSLKEEKFGIGSLLRLGLLLDPLGGALGDTMLPNATGVCSAAFMYQECEPVFILESVTRGCFLGRDL